MSNLISTALPLLAGLLIGTFFFFGLWWTVRRAVASRRPARWLIGSMLLRFGVALGAFCLIGSSHWLAWVLCLAALCWPRDAAVVDWAGGQEPDSATAKSHYAP